MNAPIPDAQRYWRAGHPRPPAPTTATDAALSDDANMETLLRERLISLIRDAVVLANQCGFDVFNALTMMDNLTFLKALRVSFVVIVIYIRFRVINIVQFMHTVRRRGRTLEILPRQLEDYTFSWNAVCWRRSCWERHWSSHVMSILVALVILLLVSTQRLYHMALEASFRR